MKQPPMTPPETEARPLHDLAIVILSMNEAHWLEALFPTLVDSTEGLSVEVIVADIESDDQTAELVDRYPFARRVPVLNGGFAHANNAALLTANARFVLFLNADTEIKAGQFSELLQLMDERPLIGMLGVRQEDAAGELFPTMRRFAKTRRQLAEALWSERLAPSLGQRVLDMSLYEVETPCDWTIGSFMLVRAEALAATGFMDERFFFTAEEQDFCLRMRQAGWEIVHVPQMTIIHHVGKRGPSPRIEAQMAFAECQYIGKHFGPIRRKLYRGALALNYGLRAVPGVLPRDRRAGASSALQVVLGRRGAPFVEPPRAALPAGTLDAVIRGRPV